MFWAAIEVAYGDCPTSEPSKISQRLARYMICHSVQPKSSGLRECPENGVFHRDMVWRLGSNLGCPLGKPREYSSSYHYTCLMRIFSSMIYLWSDFGRTLEEIALTFEGRSQKSKFSSAKMLGSTSVLERDNLIHLIRYLLYLIRT